MVEVNLWSGLRAMADGQTRVEVEATNVGEVLRALATRFPGLEDFLEDNVSVAVDGTVIVSDLTHPVKPDSEVWLMQRLKGG